MPSVDKGVAQTQDIGASLPPVEALRCSSHSQLFLYLLPMILIAQLTMPVMHSSMFEHASMAL